MSVWIDEQPVTSIAGARPVRLSGFLTASRGARVPVGIPGRLSQLLGTAGAPDGRRASLQLRVPCATLADRVAAMAAVEAATTDAVRSLRTADRPGIVTRAVVESMTWSELPGAPGLTIPTLLCDITWLAIDGGSLAWPATGPILLGTTAAPIAVGSLPSLGWLFAWGGSSPLTITYTPANGLGVTTCVITQTLATGEHLACDLDTNDVWRVTSSTRARISTVVGTLPVPSPSDALGTLLPSLTLSSGTGLLVPTTCHRV